MCHSIIEKIREHLSESVGVRNDGRQIANRQLKTDPLFRCDRTKSIDRPFQQLSHVRWDAVEAHLAGVKARQFEQILNQTMEPFGLLADDGSRPLEALLPDNGPLCDRLGEALDGGQRSL